MTQTVWGFSRDDVEGSFFPTYLAEGVFDVSSFETIDREGVGRLIEIAVREGRAARPELTFACGIIRFDLARFDGRASAAWDLTADPGCRGIDNMLEL